MAARHSRDSTRSSFDGSDNSRQTTDSPQATSPAPYRDDTSAPTALTPAVPTRLSLPSLLPPILSPSISPSSPLRLRQYPPPPTPPLPHPRTPVIPPKPPLLLLVVDPLPERLSAQPSSTPARRPTPAERPARHPTLASSPRPTEKRTRPSTFRTPHRLPTTTDLLP
jgi:hypothetical protein